MVAILEAQPQPGTLVQVQGVGILLLGASGMGKSETALALLHEGHSLVADDLVCYSRQANALIGSAPAALRGKLHIRDLGVLEVANLFGAQAICPQCNIDLVVKLYLGASGTEENLTLPNQTSLPILQRPVPMFRIQHALQRPISLLLMTLVKQVQSLQQTEEMMAGKLAS